MAYGILYGDGKGNVHVSMGYIEDVSCFMRQTAGLANTRAHILYARSQLTPEAVQIFEQLTKRSGDIKESELNEILAQLDKTQSVNGERK